MSVLIYDERWDTVAPPKFFLELKQQTEHQIPVDSQCTLAGVESLSQQISALDSDELQITVFGGGGILDKVKLVALNESSPIHPYVTRGRAGVVAIPQQSDTKLTLIPTTLGTGSEANAKAVLEVSSERRRLVVFKKPASFSYLHQPEAYTFLTEQQINHGILEVFFRCLGIFIVTNGESEKRFLEYFSTAAQYLKESIVISKVKTEMNALSELNKPGRSSHSNHSAQSTCFAQLTHSTYSNYLDKSDNSDYQSDLHHLGYPTNSNNSGYLNYLAKIAALSAQTHEAPIETSKTGLLWTWPLWYLANELASIAKVTKMEATIALAKPVISRVGTFGHGTQEKISQLNNILGESLTEFIDRFAIKPDKNTALRLAKFPLDKLVTQTLSQWSGTSLPLGLVTRIQLEEIYREVKNIYA